MPGYYHKKYPSHPTAFQLPWQRVIISLFFFFWKKFHFFFFLWKQMDKLWLKTLSIPQALILATLIRSTNLKLFPITWILHESTPTQDLKFVLKHVAPSYFFCISRLVLIFQIRYTCYLWQINHKLSENSYVTWSLQT